MDRARLRKLLPLAPAAAALIVYAGTLAAGFVYDDEVFIRTNRWVHEPGALAGVISQPFLASPPAGTTNYYRPLVVALYNVAWQAGGGSPAAFHLLNVVMHMVNATLVFLLVRRLSAGLGLALGAALLFSVHPLNVEAVAWASCLPELGYAAFGLSALLLHAGSRRVAACVMFALACLCKETALAFLPLLIVLELCLHPGRRSPRDVLPFFGVAAVYLAIRTTVLGGFVAAGAHSSRTLADALLNAPWLVLLYVKSMLVPIPLLVEHVVPLAKTAADPRFVVGVLVIAAAIFAVVRLQRVRPDLAFAVCLTLFTLVPALYLPGLGRDPFAERYAYLGVAGVCWMAAAALKKGDTPLFGKRGVSPFLIAALALASGYRTVTRAAEWRDDRSLGVASIRDEPEAPIGYLLLGTWQNQSGDKPGALRTFEDGVVHAPGDIDLAINAIALSLELSRTTPSDAVAAYRRLLPQAPGSTLLHFNLGQALLSDGRRDEARAAFTRSLELAPASVRAMNALAVIASQDGDAGSAVQLLRRALAIDDRSIPALQQLGVALLRSGDVAGAVAALERAVQLNPSDKEALSRLGVAYARAGRPNEAQRAFEQALAIDPGFAPARQNLERLRQMSQ